MEVTIPFCNLELISAQCCEEALFEHARAAIATSTSHTHVTPTWHDACACVDVGGAIWDTRVGLKGGIWRWSGGVGVVGVGVGGGGAAPSGAGLVGLPRHMCNKADHISMPYVIGLYFSLSGQALRYNQEE